MGKGKVTKRVVNGEELGWQYRWRTPEGKQRKRFYDRKSDAEAFAAKNENALRENTYIDPVKGKETFASVAGRWHADDTRSPNYQAGVESTLRLHIFPVIGDKAINSITDADIKALVQSLTAKDFAASTVRNYMTLVRTIFKAAIRQKLRGDNPCDAIRLPKGGAPKVRPLEPVQVKALIQHIEPRYRALIILAATTGARQGELFGLQIGDVNWDKTSPSVHFKRQLQVERNRGVVVRPLKDYEDRVIPVPTEVLAELGRHINQVAPSPEGYLFTRSSGGLMHARMFNARPWSRARIAASEQFGLEASLSGPDEQEMAAENIARSRQLAEVGMHDLRDYYVSLLIRRGSSVTDVSELLGHSSQSTTLRHYAHLWADHRGRTRHIVGENLREIIPAVP